VSPESGRGAREIGLGPLARLKADPGRAAILTDVDGTLAPIVERPEEAALPARASELLRRLSERYGLVGCISGRRADEARRLVGVEEIAYAGNHGLELLLPGESEPRFDAALDGHEGEAAAFVSELTREALSAAGVRLEDKGPIQSLHWRGAEDERAAEAWAEDLAAAAARAGLEPRWGRKVLELRPPGGSGKDAAVAALLATPPTPPRSSFQPDSGGKVDRAVYAGDDRTDLDAFRRLRELRDAGSLDVAVSVGVLSGEGPDEIGEKADLTVDGPAGWLALLEELAG
jgi:trehalose 6-phosphate phosphatase